MMTTRLLVILALIWAHPEHINRIDLQELLSHPMTFNGKMVQLRAKLGSNPEFFGIFAPTGSPRPTIWVDTPEDLLSAKDKPVSFQLRNDRSWKAVTACDASSNCCAAVATITGRFDAVNDDPFPWHHEYGVPGGFGHLNYYPTRIVVKAVSHVKKFPCNAALVDTNSKTLALPEAASAALENSGVLPKESGVAKYDLDQDINPFILRGSFFGKGIDSYAVLVKESSARKVGIALCHALTCSVLGPGGVKVHRNLRERAGSAAEEDFGWINVWTVAAPRRLVVNQLNPGPLAPMKSEGLLVMRTEGASAIIYYSDGAWHWYQVEE